MGSLNRERISLSRGKVRNRIMASTNRLQVCWLFTGILLRSPHDNTSLMPAKTAAIRRGVELTESTPAVD